MARAAEPPRQGRANPSPANRAGCLPAVPDWGWIFIEAKFDLGIKTSENADKLAAWLALYPEHAPTLFDVDRISEVTHGEFPEQLLRNMVFADLLRDEGEESHVIALGREEDKTRIEQWLDACLASDCPVGAKRLTWEQIYRTLPPSSGDLAALRSYFENKSYSMRPAFNLWAQS
jgi:hypothetical protein